MIDSSNALSGLVPCRSEDPTLWSVIAQSSRDYCFPPQHLRTQLYMLSVSTSTPCTSGIFFVRSRTAATFFVLGRCTPDTPPSISLQLENERVRSPNGSAILKLVYIVMSAGARKGSPALGWPARRLLDRGSLPQSGPFPARLVWTLPNRNLLQTRVSNANTATVQLYARNRRIRIQGIFSHLTCTAPQHL